jgi:hypothetical protein
MTIRIVSYTPSISPLVMAFVDIVLDDWVRLQQTIAKVKRRIGTVNSETAALTHVGREIANKTFDALNIRGHSLGRTDGGQINPYSARTNRMLTE